MTGEIRVRLARARHPIQPGGRAPAPGALALVQSFINSHYDLEVSTMAPICSRRRRRCGTWLRDHDLIEPGAPASTSATVERAVGRTGGPARRSRAGPPATAHAGASALIET